VVVLLGSYVSLPSLGPVYIPDACANLLHQDPLEAPAKTSSFAFASGLTGLPELKGNGWRFALAAGLADNAAFFTELQVDVNGEAGLPEAQSGQPEENEVLVNHDVRSVLRTGLA